MTLIGDNFILAGYDDTNDKIESVLLKISVLRIAKIKDLNESLK